MRAALFIAVLFATNIVAAADLPTEARCDYLIATALKMPYQEGGWKLLSSKTVQECFRRFPALDKKYFPPPAPIAPVSQSRAL